MELTRYKRSLTHRPGNEESIFNYLKASTISTPFVSGYETHLITDMVWSNEKNWMDESIYEHCNIDPNNPLQKFTLYGLVDDYFQAKADWFFPLVCAGNIARANDNGILLKLGLNTLDIIAYKSAMIIYLREPGIDTINIFNFIPNKMDEMLLQYFLENKTSLASFLQNLEKMAVEKSIESLEQYL